MNVYYITLSFYLNIFSTLAKSSRGQVWFVNEPRNRNNTSGKIGTTESKNQLHQRRIVKHVDIDIGILRQSRECMYAHTIVRQLHNSVNLIWNEFLAYEAEEWAIHLASDVGYLKHSSFKLPNGSSYGENLYEEIGGDAPTQCHEAVYEWYKEIHNYDFNNPMVTADTGHFTQLVWSKTKEVGVGIAYNKATKRNVVVARYMPAGNSNYDRRHMEKYVQKRKDETAIEKAIELLPFWARTPLSIDLTVVKHIDVQDKKQPCIDKIRCWFFVRINDCSNPSRMRFMLNNCYKSCTQCKPGFPIDGGWSNWVRVSECSFTCGGGLTIWYRFCTDPTPRNGGKKCEGRSIKTELCNTEKCPQTDLTLVDKNPQCLEYTTLGFCYSGIHMTWMQLNCKKSCRAYLEYFWMTEFY